jgi:membrane protein YdbS with pleckstrin-like domain
MLNSLRHFAERLLRLPHDPTPPPGHEATTRIFRAAPNYYKYLLVIWGLRTAGALAIITIAVVIPSGVGAAALVNQGNNWGLLLWLVPITALAVNVLISLFYLAVLHLDFEKRWYMVTDRSLRIREGVVAVREMTVNFANIQNISISQGPLERILGIANLRVDTAGGGGRDDAHHARENLHTAWFRAIDNADQVRGVIQERLRLLKDSGLGDHEERLAQQRAEPGPPAIISALRQVHAEAVALRSAMRSS